MSNQLGRKYDIIINGGGIVGFTLLNSILKSPHLNRLKVLLIEQSKKPSSFNQPSRIVNKPEDPNDHTESEKKFSNRVSSITQTSKRAFENLGVWEGLKEFSKDVTDIKVWNYDYSNKIVFQQNNSCNSRNKTTNKVVFSVVENNRISMALLDSIHRHPNAKDTIKWNTSLQSLSKSTTNSNLIDICAKDNDQSGEEIQASANLILGCDGFKSKVRELAHIKYNEYNLNKTAVVGTVMMDMMSRGASGNNNVAYQRFSSSKDTVAALLPLDNEYSSFVISAPNDYAKYLSECDNETFVQEFNKLLCDEESPENPVLNSLHNLANTACGLIRTTIQPALASRGINLGQVDLGSAGLESCPRLSEVVDDSRAMFPLLFGWTSPKMVASLPGECGAKVALLGDASHRIHPLAGQGLNLGIQDATELVKQLEKFAKSGEDMSNDKALCRALKRYELRRQAYIVPMSLGIFSMQNLFRILPSTALSGINSCDFIKSTSVSIANGC